MNEEIQSMNENLNSKCSIDDFQYYKKELNFKIDKNEFEQLSQEYSEKVASIDYKVQNFD